MSIEVTCVCGKQYVLDDKLAGKRVRCKVCRGEIVVTSDFMGAALVGNPSPAPSPIASSGAPVQPPASVTTPWIAPEVPYPDTHNWGSRASNPALLKFDAVSYFRNNPFTFLGMLGLASIGLPLLVRGIGWYGLIPIGLSVVWFVLDIFKTRSKLAYGCVNPAIVVGEKPWRIAIYADLSKGGGYRPAILVQTIGLRNILGGPAQIGMPLATVSLYQDGEHSDAWAAFSPTLIQLATRKLPQVQRIMASIPAKDWDALAAGMARIDLRQDGLYKLWISNQRVGKLHFTLWAERGIVTVVCALFFLMMCVVVPAKDERKPRSTANSQSAPSTPAPVTPTAPPSPTPAKPSTSAPMPAPKPIAPTPVTPAPVAPRTAAPKPASEVEKDASLEKVEIYWGNKWWKGRVLKRENGKLFVHYDGWGSNFDEWVTPDRTRPLP